MIFLCIVLVFGSWTTTAENKTKRTLSQELYNYGETTPIVTYNDNLGPKPLTLVNTPQGLKVYEPSFNTKPASQPITYEYQQYPTNVVFAKQPLHIGYNLNQPIQSHRHQEPISSTTTLHNFMPSEAAISPLHGQGLPSYENNPYASNIKLHQFHNHQLQTPRRYINSDGRIIYNQNQIPFIQPNINHPQLNNRGLLYPNQPLPPHYQFQPRTEKAVIVDYPNQNYNSRPNTVSPNINSKVVISQRKQPHQVNLPHKVILKGDDGNKRTGGNNAIKDTEEIETDIEDNLEENDSSEQQEQDPAYSKYSFDYEDNENYDNSSAEIDEYDENDNKKETPISKKHPKKSSRKRTSNNTERHRDRNSKDARSELDRSVKRPKMIYKSVKYSKDVNRNPKVDFLEGRHTENVPVTQKHRYFKEKWYLSKNTDHHQETI